MQRERGVSERYREYEWSVLSAESTAAALYGPTLTTGLNTHDKTSSMSYKIPYTQCNKQEASNIDTLVEA